MLGRRILTRMTRLGLAMYAWLWCMSFTVCAYDDPIADMMVGDKTALLSEAAEDAVPGDDLTQPGDDIDAITEETEDLSEIPEKGDPAELPDEEDALIDDEIESEEALDEEIEEITGEDSASLLGDAVETGIAFNVSSLTIVSLDDTSMFNLTVKGLGELETIAAENLTLTLEDVPEA